MKPCIQDLEKSVRHAKANKKKSSHLESQLTALQNQDFLKTKTREMEKFGVRNPLLLIVVLVQSILIIWLVT